MIIGQTLNKIRKLNDQLKNKILSTWNLTTLNIIMFFFISHQDWARRRRKTKYDILFSKKKSNKVMKIMKQITKKKYWRKSTEIRWDLMLSRHRFKLVYLMDNSNGGITDAIKKKKYSKNSSRYKDIRCFVCWNENRCVEIN